MMQIAKHTIEFEGRVGPINAYKNPISLDLSPITVFIGSQATGKSLVTELLYFLCDFRYLASKYLKQEETSNGLYLKQKGIFNGFEEILRQIRWGANDNSYSFIDKDTKIKHTIENSNGEKEHSLIYKLEFLYAELENLDNLNKAIFLSSHRIWLSDLINSKLEYLQKEACIPIREITNILCSAAINYQKSGTDLLKEVDEISKLMELGLGGHATFSKEAPFNWKWLSDKYNKLDEIKAISSAQMQTWPITTISKILLNTEIEQRPKFIYIDEPENHLDTSAQIEIAKLLAYLCNKGFRIIITTRSLFILQTLNNLVLYPKLLTSKDPYNLPDCMFRLKPGDVSGYLFSDNTISSILDKKSGELDESRLSKSLKDLK